MRWVFFLVQGASPRINWWFKRAQVLTVLGLSLRHGTNDAQKTMGIITMALLAGRAIPSSLLSEAAQEILLGVQRLMDHPNVASDHAVRAKALENRVEQVYREAIAALFAHPQDIEHAVNMLKRREIYRHLSNAADRGDEAVNVLSDIVVKMT